MLKLKAIRTFLLATAYACLLSRAGGEPITDGKREIIGPPLNAYNDCLMSKAKGYTIETKESAEAIQQATLSACDMNRGAVLEAFKKVGFGEKDVQEFDDHLFKQIMLTIVDTRAAIHRQELMTKSEVNRIYFAALECSNHAFGKLLKRYGAIEAAKAGSWAECISQWNQAARAWETYDHAETGDRATALLYERWRKGDAAKRLAPLL
jgi:hypothetical protein